MKFFRYGIGAAALILFAGLSNNIYAKEKNSSNSLKQVPFNKVELNDNFWLPRLKIQKEVLVPFSLNKMEYSIENFRSVAAHLRGEEVTRKFVGRNYSSSDLFKVMEGVAYILMIEKDAALEAKMDEIIDIIAASQKPDGYLYEHHILPEHLLSESFSESMRMMAEIQKIKQILPGIDCGACGSPTCKAFAEDIVRGQADIKLCRVMNCSLKGDAEDDS